MDFSAQPMLTISRLYGSEGHPTFSGMASHHHSLYFVPLSLPRTPQCVCHSTCISRFNDPTRLFYVKAASKNLICSWERRQPEAWQFSTMRARLLDLGIAITLGREVHQFSATCARDFCM